MEKGDNIWKTTNFIFITRSVINYCLYYQPPMTSGKRPAMPVSKRLPGYREGSLFLPRTEIRERVCDRCTHAARSRFWRYLLVCFRSGNDQINTKTQFKHRFKAWKEPAQTQCSCGFTGGRSDVTWTHGLLVPNQALYQTELHPEKRLEADVLGTYRRDYASVSNYSVHPFG